MLEIHVPARTVLISDVRGLPTGSQGVADTEYDFRRGRVIGDVRLDNCFTDFERDRDLLARVRLRNPSDGTALTLWMDRSYHYAMLFTGDPLPDVDRRSIAVEPMTCPPNAFRSGEALVRLEPGASSSSVWGLTPP